MGYEYSYPVTDTINKVIPKELYYTAGTYIHMGTEYGFIVYTYTNNNGISYYSKFLIVDFTMEYAQDNLGNIIKTQPTYKMETILDSFLESSNNHGASDWEIIQPYSYLGTDIILHNAYIMATIENEDELNAYDINYDKNTDAGAIISQASINYYATKDVSTSNFSSLANWTVETAITKSLDYIGNTEIPYVSTGQESLVWQLMLMESL